MKNLETAIKNIISQKLESGVVETLVEEQLQVSINHALKDIFGSYGDVTKMLEGKLKESISPFLESYDYSRFMVKVESVLDNVLRETALPDKTLIENVGKLLENKSVPKLVKMEDLFTAWCKMLADNVETLGLEIDYEDGPTFDAVQVLCEIHEDERSSWSSIESLTIEFSCEHDPRHNVSFSASRWKSSSNKNWDLEVKLSTDIKDIADMNEFEIFLMRLQRNFADVSIERDDYYVDEYVTPTAEPEATYS